MSDVRLRPSQGVFAQLLGRVRPELADLVAEQGRVQTAVIGLGRQGMRHAGLMKAHGTPVTAAVAPGQGGMCAHETIPVYDTVMDMLAEHPEIAVASVWRHFSSAADAAIATIAAGIPVVVIVTEGIPLKDARRVRLAARQHRALVFGPNAPGIVFPPERLMIGMLPDVFMAAEPEPDRVSAAGVSVCSRSGAILYHVADALTRAGVAQNAVLGIGGDAALGTSFAELVPQLMAFAQTDAVVVAGEIGGCQEEQLAAAIKAHPDRYPKPMVALLAGRRAPVGRTMGHAGALVSPGQTWGTFASKKAALQEAGVTVVNGQRALMREVGRLVGNRCYFPLERYDARVRARQQASPAVPGWSTSIAHVSANVVVLRGHALTDLIGTRRYLEAVALLIGGELPDRGELARLDRIACAAALAPVTSPVDAPGASLSTRLVGALLSGGGAPALEGIDTDTAADWIGRVVGCLACILENPLRPGKSFAELACRAVAGEMADDASRVRIIEAMMVACIDHGVTPPSTQATMLAASVRAPFELAMTAGIVAITDVHGGAGARTAQFLLACTERARSDGVDVRQAAEAMIAERVVSGERIEGLGHRVHGRDPRCDALRKLARRTGVGGPCVTALREVEQAFRTVRGLQLPINVDGVLGSIVADLGLAPVVANALFILGRVGGLAAHYFEEVTTQLPMRQIDFSRAIYRG